MKSQQNMCMNSSCEHASPILRGKNKGRPLAGFFKLALVLLALFTFNEAHSSHIVGGDITYSYLSSTATSNTYRVKLTIFRDCAGITMPSNMQVRVVNAQTNGLIQNLTLLRVGPVIERSIICQGQVTRCTNPSSPINGVQEYVYEVNLTMPNTLTYPVRLDYAQCCRANGITNLNSSGSQETFLTTTIPAQNMAYNNNSPIFLNPSNGVYCLGQLASLSLNAFDPDGDALVYSLVPARRSFTNNVLYAGSFNALSPLSSSTPITIDPSTGIINFTPTVLNQRAVIAIRAEEYRNGVKIGEVYRDLEVTIINCGANATPVIAPINNQVVNVGQTICIPVTVTDANNNTISVTATGGILPPATFTILSSGPGFTNAEFCFTPTSAHAANTFAISINALDNNCPIPAGSVRTFNITVPCAETQTLQTSSTAATCGLSDGTATASMPSGVAPFSYSWTGPNGFSSSSQSISGVPSGTYSVTIVDGMHCTGTSNVTIGGSSLPISLNSEIIHASCNENNGSVEWTASNGVSPYSYSLDGSTPQASGLFSNLAPGTYSVAVVDANNCPATSTVTILAASDTTPPTALCKDITLYLDANGFANIYAADVDNGSYDDCNSIILSINELSFDCSQLGLNEVVLTVTDANNNVSSCTANVTVLDTIVPDLHCQNASVYLDANGQATIVHGQVLHHDHEPCEVTSIWLSQSDFTCADLGANTITVYASDNSNNIGTCSSIVTVIDNSAPVADIAILETVTGECNASVMAPTASDNCGGTIVATTNDPIYYDAQGSYSITWTYDDGNGNISSQTQDVVVDDQTPPQANCKDFTLNFINGVGVVEASDVNDNSSDNCGIASMSVSPNTFTCEDAGTHEVTLTVVDINGNTSSCTANVTIEEQLSCSIVSVPNSSVFTGGNPNTIYLGYGAQSTTLSTTVNGGNSYSYNWTPSGELSCSDCPNPVFTPSAAGNYTFTVEVTNENGCSSICEITICVIDARAPGNGKGNGNGNGKVIICHVPPGNPNNPQTLSISPNAVNTHLTLHGGDQLGPCGTTCGPVTRSANEIGEMLINEGFETIVYPNPTNGEFTIMIHSDSQEPIHAALYSITGSKIMDLNDIQVNEPYMVKQSLSSGVYMILINQNGFQEAVKLIRRD